MTPDGLEKRRWRRRVPGLWQTGESKRVRRYILYLCLGRGFAGKARGLALLIHGVWRTMSPFEVPEGPYSIEKIMESIRVQVVDPAKGAAASAAPAADAAEAEAADAPRPLISDGGPTSRLLAQLELLRQRQSLDPGYRIKSHRRLVGGLLDFVKRIIHWGSRPYTDAVRLRQEAYNEAVLQALREVSLQFESNLAYITSFHQAIHDLQRNDAVHADRLNGLVGGIEELSGRLTEVGGELTRRIHEQALAGDQARARLDTLYARYDLAPLARLTAERRRIEALEATRGTYEDIRCRQFPYLKYFEGVPGQVLDIGCGRGEMLHELRIHGVECWGVDTDPLMVKVCQDRGDHAECIDGLTALGRLEPGALGGIFAAQVIEHFFPGDVVRFIAMARQKLARGGCILLETLNPGTLGVHAKSYWRDLEHKQMIHPEYLKGMLELAGFESVEIHTLSPFQAGEKLPELPPASALGLSEDARQALQERLDKMNDLLFGMQDYVVIARQGDPAPPESAVGEAQEAPQA
jgi:SAM-dependent methyltransferase